jgi:hypothetical protein
MWEAMILLRPAQQCYANRALDLPKLFSGCAAAQLFFKLLKLNRTLNPNLKLEDREVSRSKSNYSHL